MSMLSDKELDFLKKKVLAPKTTAMKQQAPTKRAQPPLVKEPELSKKTKQIEQKTETKEPKPEKKKEPIIEEVVSPAPKVVEKKFEKKRRLHQLLHKRPLQNQQFQDRLPNLKKSRNMLLKA